MTENTNSLREIIPLVNQRKNFNRKIYLKKNRKNLFLKPQNENPFKASTSNQQAVRSHHPLAVANLVNCSLIGDQLKCNK